VSDWLALPLPPIGELRVLPNDPQRVEEGDYVKQESVVGLAYNPVTNVLIALSASGLNRFVARGAKSFHLEVHHRGGL
jgi:hypothetical protein